MPGHLFICKCDITKIACDAWLLPTYAEKTIDLTWHNQCLEQLGACDGSLDAFDVGPDFGDQQKTALPKHWPEHPEYPMPILTVIGSKVKQDIQWYIDSVKQFLDAYSRQPSCFLSYRHRPLLAIPLIGVGKGGAGDRVAGIIDELLSFAQDTANERNVDIVLSVFDSIHYTVCQKHRKNLDEQRNFWSEISEQQRAYADNIINFARRGELVLFLGAGVSAGAGLPSWGQLLTHLTEKSGISEEQHKSLSGFNFLDQAEILKRELAKNNIDMNQEIVALLGAKQLYSLTHALISNWPVNEAVTQNYDTMYENACRDSKQPLSVIPYTFDENSDKWLLKMHGCITQPDDIVLSRSDYLDYDYTRSALSGIVQALLVTKHMLFLGFSLTDDHFIQLIFDVHKAVKGMVKSTGHKFGTVLTVLQCDLQQELWSGELDFISAGEPNAEFSAAINTHDIILDYITCRTHTSHRYLFRREFETLMAEEDIQLRDELRRVYEKLNTNTDSNAIADFKEYLQSLGFIDDD